MCVHACVRVCMCDDFLKDNIYDSFTKVLLKKILIAVYFFHSPFLNSTWRHFLILYFFIENIYIYIYIYIYMTAFLKGKIIVLF